MLNPIHISEVVQYKTLYNKAQHILNDCDKLRDTLMFQGEDEETKQALYKAMDEIKIFMDNLKVKKGYVVAQ